MQRHAGGIAGCRGVGADAADEDLRLVEVVAEVHARHHRLQVLQVVDLRFLEAVRPDCDDRSRDVLQRLLAPLCGDEDGVPFRWCLCAVLRVVRLAAGLCQGLAACCDKKGSDENSIVGFHR